MGASTLGAHKDEPDRTRPGQGLEGLRVQIDCDSIVMWTKHRMHPLIPILAVCTPWIYS